VRGKAAKDKGTVAQPADLERAKKEGIEMCKVEKKKGCEHPEKLKGKPEECTPEQIRECHGQVVEHPFVKEK
jgi:hypothetical protein